MRDSRKGVSLHVFVVVNGSTIGGYLFGKLRWVVSLS
jgi:hypothetical protein